MFRRNRYHRRGVTLHADGTVMVYGFRRRETERLTRMVLVSLALEEEQRRQANREAREARRKQS